MPKYIDKAFRIDEDGHIEEIGCFICGIKGSLYREGDEYKCPEHLLTIIEEDDEEDELRGQPE